MEDRPGTNCEEWLHFSRIYRAHTPRQTMIRFRSKYFGLVTAFVVIAIVRLTPMSLRSYAECGEKIPAPSGRSCTQSTHIVYIKVPKTGSSTVSSILCQFGRAKNLTFALPRAGISFGIAPLAVEKISPIAKGLHYDILLHHSTLNSKTVKMLFPGDTKIIASVREPLSHFISSYYYYGYEKYLSKEEWQTGNEMLKIETLINKAYLKYINNNNSRGDLVFNRLSQRLGVPLNKSRDALFVKTYLPQLEQDLDMVLIQSYLNESLVLLKRRLCWHISDIVYTSHKVQEYGLRETNESYSPVSKQRHRQLAVAEYLIYEHFYGKFWNEVRRESRDFFQEVKYFKRILESFQSFCHENPTSNEFITFPRSQWSTQFVLYGTKCENLHLNMHTFTSKQRESQKSHISNMTQNKFNE